MKHTRILTLAAALALAASACSPIYVLRAGVAEAKLLSRRQSIAGLLSSPDTPPQLRRKLLLVEDARTYARERLGLDVGDSYTTYAAVESDTLMLVLSAARKDRFEQLTWWFPIVGRIPYKGYFDPDDALDAARRYEENGYDAYVRPTTAFSTLGWFSDPLLSTIVRFDSVALFSTVVHELTHNTLYLPSQASFNESFASFVGDVAAIDYFCRLEGDAGRRCHLARSVWHDNLVFGAFLEDLVHRLEALYGRKDLTRDQILERRQPVFEDARRRFRDEVQPRFEVLSYDSFLTMPLNNATLIARRLYYDRLELFDAAWKRHDQNLPGTVADILREARAHAERPYERVGARAPLPGGRP